MSNNRLVRDTKAAKLGGTPKNQTKTGQKTVPEGAVQLTNDNALPFIARFLNDLTMEFRKLNSTLEKLAEKVNG